MGPKTFQDVARPPEPQLVSDIPVQAPARQSGDDTDFVVSNKPNPTVGDPKPKAADNKISRPKPTLAIVVAAAAVICLAAGAYFKYLAS